MTLIKTLLRAATAGVLIVGASHAFGQTWNISAGNGSGQAGANVPITISINQTTGSEEAFTLDLKMSDASKINASSINFSGCLTGAPAGIISTCQLRPAPNNDTIRINWASATAGVAWPRTFNGSLVFPIAAGAAPGDVNLTWTATTINGTVNATPGKITVTAAPQSALSIDPPTSHDFGSVDLNVSPKPTHTFVARNSGAAGTSLTINTVVTSGAPYTVAGCVGAVLNAGQTCNAVVTYNPTAIGTHNGTVTFTSTASVTPTQAVNVTGTATSQPVFVFTGFNGNFGHGMPDMDPNTVTRTGSVRNNGSAEGAVSCSISGPDAAVFALNPNPFSPTLAPGASANFDVVFTMPGDAEVGDDYNATLVCTTGAAAPVTVYESALSFHVGAAAVVAPIPTLQEWGLILLSLMMAGVAAVGIGRARKW